MAINTVLLNLSLAPIKDRGGALGGTGNVFIVTYNGKYHLCIGKVGNLFSIRSFNFNDNELAQARKLEKALEWAINEKRIYDPKFCKVTLNRGSNATISFKGHGRGGLIARAGDWLFGCQYQEVEDASYTFTPQNCSSNPANAAHEMLFRLYTALNKLNLCPQDEKEICAAYANAFRQKAQQDLTSKTTKVIEWTKTEIDSIESHFQNPRIVFMKEMNARFSTWEKHNGDLIASSGVSKDGIDKYLEDWASYIFVTKNICSVQNRQTAIRLAQTESDKVLSNLTTILLKYSFNLSFTHFLEAKCSQGDGGAKWDGFSDCYGFIKSFFPTAEYKRITSAAWIAIAGKIGSVGSGGINTLKGLSDQIEQRLKTPIIELFSKMQVNRNGIRDLAQQKYWDWAAGINSNAQGKPLFGKSVSPEDMRPEFASPSDGKPGGRIYNFFHRNFLADIDINSKLYMVGSFDATWNAFEKKLDDLFIRSVQDKINSGEHAQKRPVAPSSSSPISVMSGTESVKERGPFTYDEQLGYLHNMPRTIFESLTNYYTNGIPNKNSARSASCYYDLKTMLEGKTDTPNDPFKNGIVNPIMELGGYRDVYSVFRELIKIRPSVDISVDIPVVALHGENLKDPGDAMNDPWYAFNIFKIFAEAAMMTSILGSTSKPTIPPERRLELLEEARKWNNEAISHFLSWYKMAPKKDISKMSFQEIIAALNKVLANPGVKKELAGMAKLAIAQRAMIEGNIIGLTYLTKKDPTYSDYETALDKIQVLYDTKVALGAGSSLIPLWQICDADHPFLRLAILKNRGEALIGLASKGEGHISAKARLDKVNAGLEDIHQNLAFVLGLYGAPYGLTFDKAALSSCQRIESHKAFRAIVNKIYYDGTLTPEEKRKRITDFITAWVWSEVPEVNGWGMRGFIIKDNRLLDPVGFKEISSSVTKTNHEIDFEAERTFTIELMGREYCKQIGLIDN